MTQYRLKTPEQFDDLMKAIQRDMPKAKWSVDNQRNGSDYIYPCSIIVKDNIIDFGMDINEHLPDWEIGKSIFNPINEAIEDLISIPQNEDGSITISPELQVKLVVALRGGEK